MQKNGWNELADETGEFIVVSPESPGNIWFLSRDGMIFEKIIGQLKEDYGIDETRIYLTGFSNGAIMTREAAYSYPHLFAAISASNGPWFDTFSMQQADSSEEPEKLSDEILSVMEQFREEGWEMPCVFFYGDNDPAAKAEENRALPLFLSSNRCGNEHTHEYSPEHNQLCAGPDAQDYLRGSCSSVEMYCAPDGTARVSVIVMKNMPHGAVTEESRFAWAFMKRFRRPHGSKSVVII